MDDINVFFAEQEQRMNLPDEDVNEYVRARLEDFHRNRSHVIDRVIHAQDHPRKVDAHSGLFLTYDMEEMTPEQQVSDNEVPRRLKRKSAEPEHSAQGKKPRLCEIPNATTSGVAVLPTFFSRSDNAKHAANAIAPTKSRSKGANRTPQLAAHRKGDDPIETASSPPGRHTNCVPVGRSSTVNSSRIQNFNDESSTNEHGAAKLPVVGSVSHIAKPTVHHEGNRDAKDLPPARTIPHNSTARARKSRAAKLVAHDAINQEPTNGSSPEARMLCSEHDEGASTEDKRLQSFTPELGIPSPQSELLELSAMNTSNITSPSNSPLGASRRSSTPASLSSDTEGITSSTRATVVKPPKVRKTVSSSRNKADISKQNKGKKTTGKPALVTPLEYAQKLQLNLDLAKKRKTDYLKGKKIMYVGGDMQYASVQTRGRMDYIIKHGGTLIPSYDPSIVTHIVTDATTRPTLKALGLKSLKEIPDHIPTVTWSWVISGFGRSGYYKVKRDEEAHTTKGKAKAADDDESLLDFEFLHAAFPQRIDAGRSWQKRGQGKLAQEKGQVSTSANDLAGDFSRISSFTEDEDHQTKHQRGPAPKLVMLPPAPLTFVATGKASNTAHHNNNQSNHIHKPQSNTEDPLAEFYEKAKADRDQDRGLGQSEPDESDDEEEFLKPAEVPRRGFTCDRKEPQQRECVNQDIIDKLEELMELHKAKLGDEDRWRVYSYSKCIRALRNYPKKIKSFNEARSINGVGEKTARKIMEIIETGDLRRIGYEKTDDVEAINLFQGIYGVGRQIASMWYNNGCRTLDDVRARRGDIKLSHVQEIGLRFYDDINDRMPRSEAESIFNLIKPIALELDEHLYINIMGSFRRGKVTCGDIDILVTRPTSDGMTHAGLLPELLARLHAAGILTEDLALPDDFSALELCYRGLCKLPEPDAKRRRIDILCVPWENRGAALLYYTGDDIFNRAMRMKANVLGYSLNQRGLYAGVVRDPRNRRVKVSAGNIVASETEEEIFKILGVPWQEPHERVRG